MPVCDPNLERLERLLPQAAELLSKIHETIWADRCVSAVRDARRGVLSFVPQLWSFFAPTCEWDDLIGNEGVEIGSQIFDALDAIGERHNLRPR